MLFPDPRFRSPTVVPGESLPWVLQFELEPYVQGTKFGDSIRSLTSVAVMSEATLGDQLVISHRAQKVELPLVYLAMLWPKPLRLESPIIFDQGALEIFATKRAMVVLMGKRPA